ncbi:MAG: hypothetical protein U0235_19785 [Polyangiaceae bacterium]
MGKWTKRALVLLAFAVAALIGAFVAFELALIVVPNRTPEGYGLMPIGQLGFALLVAPFIGYVGARLVASRL